VNCSACRSRLGQRVDDELSARDRALVDAHLASCAKCRSEASRIAAVERTLVRLAQIEPSDDFTLAVMAKIAAMPAPAAKPARFWWLIVADVALWAAIGALTAIGTIRWKTIAAGAGAFAAKLGVALGTFYDVGKDFHIPTFLALGVGLEIVFLALLAAAGRKYLSRVRATLAGVLS
jgi:anti-sigma factor RsiW